MLLLSVFMSAAFGSTSRFESLLNELHEAMDERERSVDDSKRARFLNHLTNMNSVEIKSERGLVISDVLKNRNSNMNSVEIKYVEKGCYTLSRDDCCGKIDHRIGAYFNEPCVPAKDGMTMAGRECQPECWAKGQCGSGTKWQSSMGSCPARNARSNDYGSPARTARYGMQPEPVAAGCYTLSRDECCGKTDGRAQDTRYFGQPCVPAKDGMTMGGRECQPECWAMGQCGSGDRLQDAMGFCELPMAGHGTVGIRPIIVTNDYHRPFDRSVQARGVTPDGEIPAPMDKAENQH